MDLKLDSLVTSVNSTREHLTHRFTMLDPGKKKAILGVVAIGVLVTVMNLTSKDKKRERAAPDPVVTNMFSDKGSRDVGVDRMITTINRHEQGLESQKRKTDQLNDEFDKIQVSLTETKNTQIKAKQQIERTERLETELNTLRTEFLDSKKAHAEEMMAVSADAEKKVTATLESISLREQEVEKQVNSIKIQSQQAQESLLKKHNEQIKQQSLKIDVLEGKLLNISANPPVAVAPVVKPQTLTEKQDAPGAYQPLPDGAIPKDTNQTAKQASPLYPGGVEYGPVADKPGIAVHPGFADIDAPTPTQQQPAELSDNRIVAVIPEKQRLSDRKVNHFLEAMKQAGSETTRMPSTMVSSTNSNSRPTLDQGSQRPRRATQPLPPGVQANPPGQQRQAQVPTQVSTQVSPPIPFTKSAGIKTYGATGLIDDQTINQAAADYYNTNDGSTITTSTENSVEEVAAAEEAEKPDTDTFIPAGSIFSGSLITGMDAFTDLGSARDPQPTLLRVSTTAILPNRYQGDFRECFMLAEGFGQLSSERVAIRAHTLSCVNDGGEAFEVSIQAYASGEDGKEGVRGRVVSRNGQLLAQSLQAGFLGAVSQAFKGVAVPTTNEIDSSDGGSSTSRLIESTLNRDNLLHAGLNGAASAMDRIAEYFLSMAENIFPVIEISAGREIDFIMTRGVKLPSLEASN